MEAILEMVWQLIFLTFSVAVLGAVLVAVGAMAWETIELLRRDD